VERRAGPQSVARMLDSGPWGYVSCMYAEGTLDREVEMEIISWGVWSGLLLYSLAGIYWVRHTYFEGRPIMPGTVSLIPSAILVAIWAVGADVNKLHILWITPLWCLLIMFIVQATGWGRTFVNLVFSLITIGIVPLPDRLRVECPHCKALGTLRQHSFDSFENNQRCGQDQIEGKKRTLHLTCFACGEHFECAEKKLLIDTGS